MTPSSKIYAPLPLFDPAKGTTVLAPEAGGPGYWVGAPSVIFDAERNRFLLSYRRRRPRGTSSDRGHVTVVAQADDGIHFETLWGLSKEELESPSIEKCSLLHCRDGIYRLYFSYVDPADNRWRIDLLESRSPDGFDAAARREVFTAETATRAHAVPVEGVKDPSVYHIGGLYHMFLSFAAGRPGDDRDASRMHSSSDVFNTGLLVAPSALATSADGVHFSWRGTCLDVGAAGTWDQYQSRLGSVLHHQGIWYGFYDGSRGHEENYEERLGLVQSFDLARWTRLTPGGPAASVPEASGSVRYVDALPIGSEIHYYYEVVRPDGSHELRRSVVPLEP